MSMLTPAGFGGTTRRRRPVLRALAVLVTLAVMAGAAFTVYWYFVRDQPSAPAPKAVATPSCPPVKPLPAPVHPLKPSTVRVNVYNSTDRTGLAARVAAELRQRGFLVVRIANDPMRKAVAAPAQVRAGRRGAAAAATVRLLVAGSEPVVDSRTTTTVDLVLGAGFTALRTPAQAAAAATPRPAPRPSGCR